MSDATVAGRSSIWTSMAYVAIVAAGASYIQALTVVQATDGHGPVSYFVAGLADPTIFAASANIADANRQRSRLPRWSLLSVAVAALVTIGANVAAGWPHAVPPWLVRAWPPVAFLMALESLMSYIRRGRGAPHDRTSAAMNGHCPHGVAGTAEEAVVSAWSHAQDCLLAPVSFRQLEARFGVRRDRVSELVKSAQNGDGHA